jgi:Bacterial Ig domain
MFRLFFTAISIASILLLTGCVKPLAVEPNLVGNRPPEIVNIRVEGESIRVGQEARLTVEATDPDGDHLTYEWFVLLGDIRGDGSVVFYSAAFCCVGINKVTVTVKDSRGASIEQSVLINVNP